MVNDDEQGRAGQGRRSSTAAEWKELQVAVHGDGRGNSRLHDDEKAEQNCREEHSPTTTVARGLDLPAGLSCGSGETDGAHGYERQELCCRR